jgi:charged multivesicular body protein 4|mmetsp:Transcript_12378/g.35313  ORF Transcript_12378/g.35313 Transcript_12378/m.35313 type:complete len:243 (+) Transcript_12378:726-1454(+)
MFSRLFGEKRSSIGQGQDGPSRSRDQADTLVALEKLQAAADGVLKKKEYYEKRVENEVTKAKECLRNNNKNGAALALRRKKMIVAKIEGLENNYIQLEEQIMELDNVQTTTEMFAALKHAATVQKKVLSKHKVDKVDKVIDDLEENRGTMQEIQDALALGGASAEYDDAELEEELAALEAEELTGELLEKPRVEGVRLPREAAPVADDIDDLEGEMPAVPTRRPNIVKDSDKEASELLASLN